jgi:hypothetical protein
LLGFVGVKLGLSLWRNNIHYRLKQVFRHKKEVRENWRKSHNEQLNNAHFSHNNDRVINSRCLNGRQI